MANEITVLEHLVTLTDGNEILECLRKVARSELAAKPDTEDTFCASYLAAYVARLHAEAQDADQDDEPRPLSDQEIDELLVNVSISKLERLLHQRRLEVADTPAEIEETLNGMFGDPGFPTVSYTCGTCGETLRDDGHCPVCEAKCVVCRREWVDVKAGFDTCQGCANNV